MRLFLILLLGFIIHVIQAQTRVGNATEGKLSKYIGKYETNGMVVQVTINNGSLVLVVPGAPLQELIPVAANRFKSDSYDDSFFRFDEREGKVEQMISESPGGSLELKKISVTADPINAGDFLLTLKKSTEHFTFLYSETDSISVDHIAVQLERNYHKIINDFKIGKIPVTVVRIYPDMQSFHRGINFPDAPDYVLATAFGKSDFRMPSPNSVAPGDSLTLINFVAHEFTHCVHLNIDYSPNNPRWLWEGVANFESGWFVDPKGIDVVKNKQFPPFAMLINGLEYELGYVIIEAIKDIWGFDAVIDLIRKKGDVPAVLQLTQGQFEERIYAHIYKKYILN